MSYTEGVVELMLRGRRRGIFNGVQSDDDDVDKDEDIKVEDIHINAKQLTNADVQLIVESLRANELFLCLDPNQLETLARSMTIQVVQPGEIVFHHGDEGNTFYITKSGKCEGITEDDRIRQILPTQSFGELGLLYRCIRTETVSALDFAPVELFCLKGRKFREMVAQYSVGSLQSSKDALHKVKLLESLTEAQFDVVADAVHSLQFRQGDTIVRKGEPGNVLYIIQSGQVVCTDIGAGSLDDIELKEGDYFGERALMTAEPRAATVYAKTDVRVMALDREIFNSVLGPLQEVIKYNLTIRSIQSIPLLKEFPDALKHELIEKSPLRTYSEGSIILQEGDVGNDFFILVSGQVDVTQQAANGKPVHVNTLLTGDYFGETAALQNTPTKRNATVTAKSNVELLVIDNNLFQSTFKPVQSVLMQNIEMRKQMSEDKVFASSITKQSLKRSKVLGIGSFGLVCIALHQPTGRFVAVKEMYKARLEKSKQMLHVVSEKQLLSSLQHPFILKYYTALQDEKRLLIITESLLGGELFQRIVSPSGVPTPLSNSSARFYAACVYKALRYLHSRNVAYRDLKPENILLNSEGYAKLVDFGFAKKLQQKTYTLCGTPEYLAPEIVMGVGHGCQVDSWALGILIYEMVIGDSPFADAKDDHMAVCRSILRGKLTFRDDANPAWKSLVEALLVKEPTKRLSCLSTSAGQSIEQHPWFHGFDWDALLAQKLDAPWTPKVQTPDDARWFSAVDEDELQALKEWDFIYPQKDWSQF